MEEIFSNLFGGGGGGGELRLIFRRVVTESQVLTLPAGYYDILAVGTGGSGAAAFNMNKATGGGGPAWARDFGVFKVPTPVTITIGARALGVSAVNPGTPGNTGGTTTVTGIENPISLTGGGGGNIGVGGLTASGGLGGVASGGKLRADGGRGGNISTTSNTSAQSTGGGALNLFGNGSRGGDSSSTWRWAATGGAGVGGRGGDLTGSQSFSCGGGAGGGALDGLDSPNYCGPGVTGIRGNGVSPTDAEVIDLLFAFPGIVPVGSGTSSSSTLPKPGGGEGGSVSAGTQKIPFGASGGVAAPSGNMTSSSSVRGGGSGGVSGDIGSMSGDAGEAFVVISVYTEVK